MSIKLVNDLGAPLVVTAVDLVTESQAPRWNEWSSYILAGGGYVAAFMGWGGDFAKNIGIASFPWAAKSIYARVRAGMGTTRMARVSRYPSDVVVPQFAGVKLT